MSDKKTKFFHANSAPAPQATQLQLAMATVRSAWRLLLVFVLATLICACLFYYTPKSWGSIIPTFTSDFGSEPDFLDALYFSVVTIATLGYGDFRPIGIARIVASAEVFLGIVLMGLFVAKLVSQRQERFTIRLVRGQLNIEIQEFRDQLAQLMGFPGDSEEASSFYLYRASGLAKAIARYWRNENKMPGLMDVIPSRAAGRLLGELIEMLCSIERWVGDRPVEAFSGRDRVNVRNVADGTLVMAEVLVQTTKDRGMAHLKDRAVSVSMSLRDKLDLGKKIKSEPRAGQGG